MGDDKEVASLTNFAPHTPTVMATGLGGDYSGSLIAERGTSYLAAKFHDPDATAAGRWSCSSQGFDRLGHFVSHHATVDVASRTLDLPAALALIKDLQGRLDAC